MVQTIIFFRCINYLIMKKIDLIPFLLLCCCFSYSQNNKLDSLNRLIARATSDTQSINLAIEKIRFFTNIDLDSAILLGNKTIENSKTIKYKRGEANARVSLAFAHCFKGEYKAAKENLDISSEIL